MKLIDNRYWRVNKKSIPKFSLGIKLKFYGRRPIQGDIQMNLFQRSIWQLIWQKTIRYLIYFIENVITYITYS